MPVLAVVHDDDDDNRSNHDGGRSLLDKIVRDDARQMLTAAPQDGDVRLYRAVC
ncbi:hypothetical protein Rhow_002374 [Rhodococcus wratislaviensis]|uniref:Uncharacterized protein n=1 Tax=Rhodococcus wratislaviensis TaxID=44752 RepID=A0A402C5E9_RHOWR|nr:hypothetical protein Rhow_002374 [Rhodococcus wratislaviensis]